MISTVSCVTRFTVEFVLLLQLLTFSMFAHSERLASGALIAAPLCA